MGNEAKLLRQTENFINLLRIEIVLTLQKYFFKTPPKESDPLKIILLLELKTFKGFDIS